MNDSNDTANDNPPPRYRNAQWLWVAFAIFFFDQVSKRLVAGHLGLFDRIQLLGVLNITYLRNTGAAFSVLSGAAPWLFALFAVVVAVGILIWLQRHPYGNRLVAISLCLILGGALGNAVGRVVHGYVIDFIDFHIGTWHYPAFNLADCAIVIGAVMLVLDMLWPRRERTNDAVEHDS